MKISASSLKKLGFASAIAMSTSLLGGQSAEAAPPLTRSLNIDATVNSTCTIVSSAGINFGVYDITGADVDTGALPAPSAGGITINCSNGAPVWVGIDAGTHGGGTYPRNMVQTPLTADRLGYDLSFVAPGGTSADLTAGGGGTINTTGDGTDHAFPIHGRLYGTQAVSAGSYQDTVQVSVNY